MTFTKPVPGELESRGCVMGLVQKIQVLYFLSNSLVRGAEYIYPQSVHP